MPLKDIDSSKSSEDTTSNSCAREDTSTNCATGVQRDLRARTLPPSDFLRERDCKQGISSGAGSSRVDAFMTSWNEKKQEREKEMLYEECRSLSKAAVALAWTKARSAQRAEQIRSATCGTAN